MTPRQLANDIDAAYDVRDRESHTRALARLAAMAAPPDFSRLTREQLEQRRSELRVALADIDDRLVAMAAAGRRTLALPRDWPPTSLDPSD